MSCRRTSVVEEQGSLFDQPIKPRRASRRIRDKAKHHKTQQQKLNEFLAANPHFYGEFVKVARHLKALDYNNISARGIVHFMRIDRALKINRTDDYKINDHLSSRMARLVMEREQDLAGFFEIRKLRAK